MKERDRESEKHRQQEHEERFRALLMDLVKQADTTWHDARRALRKDERYNQCDLLDKENKEKIFGEHIKWEYLQFLYNITPEFLKRSAEKNSSLF